MISPEIHAHEIDRLRRALADAQEAIRKAWEIDNDPAGDLSRDWFDLPAVQDAMKAGALR